MDYTILKNTINRDNKFGEIATFEVEQKKSKFISYIFNVENSIVAKKYIQNIQSHYTDARHVVYIYAVSGNNGLNEIRYSDDGEPKGTGTKAIYELITKENLTNICVVIVRYFGGILLGAGPLSRAYLNVAKGAIDTCTKQQAIQYTDISFELEFKSYEKIKNMLEQYIISEDLIVVESTYTNVVKLVCKINVHIRDILIVSMQNIIGDTVACTNIVKKGD